MKDTGPEHPNNDNKRPNDARNIDPLNNKETIRQMMKRLDKDRNPEDQGKDGNPEDRRRWEVTTPQAQAPRAERQRNEAEDQWRKVDTPNDIIRALSAKMDAQLIAEKIAFVRNQGELASRLYDDIPWNNLTQIQGFYIQETPSSLQEEKPSSDQEISRATGRARFMGTAIPLAAEQYDRSRKGPPTLENE